MKKQKWTTLESRYLIQRPWLTARCDVVRLPDGRINSEFYVLGYPDWVNVIAITDDDRFVMVEQYRHGLDDIFTELVAGVVEPDEAPLEAAKRELLEETGYAADDWELLTVLSQNPSTSTNLTYCYIARGAHKVADQALDETEDIDVCLLSRPQLKDLLIADTMKQALMVAPLWKFLALEDSKSDK